MTILYRSMPHVSRNTKNKFKIKNVRNYYTVEVTLCTFNLHNLQKKTVVYTNRMFGFYKYSMFIYKNLLSNVQYCTVYFSNYLVLIVRHLES